MLYKYLQLLLSKLISECLELRRAVIEFSQKLTIEIHKSIKTNEKLRRGATCVPI